MTNDNKIKHMALGGEILHRALEKVVSNVKPGVTGIELNDIAEDYIFSNNAKPAFKGYKGYPSSLCVSINNIVVHGIPNNYRLCVNDVVGLDLGVVYKEYNTDSAISVIITKNGCLTAQDLIKKSKISDFSDLGASERMICVCHNALYVGIGQSKAGNRTGDIGEAIQQFVEKHGFSVVRDLVGHGVGEKIHQEPNVPNFGDKNTGALLHKGETIAIEPMITTGHCNVHVLDDNWSIATKDNSLSAHFEHTVVIDNNNAEILT